MGGVLTWFILISTFIHGVLCEHSARDLMNGFEQSQMNYADTPEKMRELNTLIEMLQNAAAFERQQQEKKSRALNMIATEDSEGPSDIPGPGGVDQDDNNNMVPIPVPVMGPLSMFMRNRDLQNLIQQQEFNEIGRQDKRGSYMALCHFKICNMGRKRTSKWSPWLRTENV